MTTNFETDRSNATHQIEYFYNSLEAYIIFPCLSAYKEAKRNFLGALTAQAKSDEFWTKLVLDIVIAGIAGGIAGFAGAAIITQFTTSCAAKIVASEKTIKALSDAIKTGSQTNCQDRSFKRRCRTCQRDKAGKSLSLAASMF